MPIEARPESVNAMDHTGRYFYRVNSYVHGPYTLFEMRGWITLDLIGKETPVKLGDDGSWAEAGLCEELWKNNSSTSPVRPKSRSNGVTAGSIATSPRSSVDDDTILGWLGTAKSTRDKQIKGFCRMPTILAPSRGQPDSKAPEEFDLRRPQAIDREESTTTALSSKPETRIVIRCVNCDNKFIMTVDASTTSAQCPSCKSVATIANQQQVDWKRSSFTFPEFTFGQWMILIILGGSFFASMFPKSSADIRSEEQELIKVRAAREIREEAESVRQAEFLRRVEFEMAKQLIEKKW